MHSPSRESAREVPKPAHTHTQGQKNHTRAGASRHERGIVQSGNLRSQVGFEGQRGKGGLCHIRTFVLGAILKVSDPLATLQTFADDDSNILLPIIKEHTHPFSKVIGGLLCPLGCGSVCKGRLQSIVLIEVDSCTETNSTLPALQNPCGVASQHQFGDTRQILVYKHP